MSLIFYSEQEDNNKEESINKYNDLFINYEQKLPTLEEALNQMFISSGAYKKKSDKLIKDILLKCKKTIDYNLDKIKEKYNKINKEDAYIICSYTCESEEKEYSPYRIIYFIRKINITNYRLSIIMWFSVLFSDRRKYFMMSFLSGGQLFQHLRKFRTFVEEKVRFYGA